MSTASAGEPVRFPQGFGWGTATASYQIEGAVDQDGRAPSIWDTFSHTPGAIRDGTNGDRADDHYHRYREDVRLMAELGLGYYRLSLAWPRLQPEGRGALNQKGIDFYARLTDELHDHGVRPWVTLYHWDLPQAVEDAGGWPARDTALRFADYSARVYEALGDRIEYWTTLNEPFCSCMRGYAMGNHAPGRTEPAAAVRALHHLLLGHGLAVQAMRDSGVAAGNQFGITLNLSAIFTDRDTEADRDAARRLDGIVNRIFLDPVLRGSYPEDFVADLAPLLDFGHVHDGDLATIAQPLDALGVNYYHRFLARAGSGDRFRGTPYVGAGDVEIVARDLPRTAAGWEVDPDGLRELLIRVWTEYDTPPLWVTENGAAYPDGVGPDGQIHDPDRIAYLDAHFRAAHAATDAGVDLRGYFVWTLMDNFEWAWGEERRFGLIYVDYDTQHRTVKDSGRWFAQVVARNGLE